MIMLEDCIERISRDIDITQNEEKKELLKSIYYHLLDHKDVMNKSIELSNEISKISKRWALVKKANEE